MTTDEQVSAVMAASRNCVKVIASHLPQSSATIEQLVPAVGMNLIFATIDVAKEIHGRAAAEGLFKGLVNSLRDYWDDIDGVHGWGRNHG